ncbi:hypothetical protein BaRGS_00017465 [Batillaria attramentaria]|uniref:Uncharacterized protein n=1 Tax=Batillaria attramentaria TaxID=370345 RepID=A0ABD0KWU1_9CAEN
MFCYQSSAFVKSRHRISAPDLQCQLSSTRLKTQPKQSGTREFLFVISIVANKTLEIPGNVNGIHNLIWLNFSDGSLSGRSRGVVRAPQHFADDRVQRSLHSKLSEVASALRSADQTWVYVAASPRPDGLVFHHFPQLLTYPPPPPFPGP